MEFEDVEEKIEWEARRVAAAFGVKTFELLSYASCSEADFEGVIAESDLLVEWTISREMGQVTDIGIGSTLAVSCCSLRYREDCAPPAWSCFLNEAWCKNQNGQCCARSCHRMAYGLYRLGLSEEIAFTNVMDELNCPFTAHEQMEARLSLPREFWPKTWREDEENTAK